AATAADDDDIDAFDLADCRHAARDIERRAFALHARGTDHDVRVGVAPTEHFDDVAHGGAVERRYDADLARQRRQRTLAARVKQALLGEPLFELIEGELPRA